MVNLNEYIWRVLELGNTNSFTRHVFFSKDLHLSKDVVPHDINEMLEYLIKRLFDYGC